MKIMTVTILPLLIVIAAVSCLSPSTFAGNDDQYVFRWKDLLRPERDLVSYPEKVLKMIPVKKGDTVVDVDPAGGYWTFKLARATGPTGTVKGLSTFTGTTEGLPEHLERMLSSEKHDPYANISFGKCPMDDIDLPVESVDVVFMSLCGRLVGDPDHIGKLQGGHFSEDAWDTNFAFAKSVYRALKPGGKLAIIALLDDMTVREHIQGKDLPAIARTPSPDIIKANYEKIGFRLILSSSLYMDRNYRKDTEDLKKMPFFKELYPSEYPVYLGNKAFMVFEKPDNG